VNDCLPDQASMSILVQGAKFLYTYAPPMRTEIWFCSVFDANSSGFKIQMRQDPTHEVSKTIWAGDFGGRHRASDFAAALRLRSRLIFFEHRI
jgi:hypothetical protein